MFPKQLFKLAILLALGGFLTTAYFQTSAPVSAAPDGLNFNVNNTADLPDTKPGDGVCLTANGNCTLRAAIMEANKHSGTDIIKLQTNATYTLTRAGNDDNAKNGDLDVRDSINLIGNNATIDANSAVTHDRVFHFVNSNNTFAISQLSDVTLTGGSTTGQGGGIWNHTFLFLEHVTVKSNHADGQGGGIANDGIILARNSAITENDCTCANAQQPGGGGIANHQQLILYTSTIDHNTAHFDGGGVWTTGESFTLVASTLAFNKADRHGGGIYVGDGQAGIVHSTIATNMADNDEDTDGFGGGIFVDPNGVAYLGHTLLANNGNAEPFLFKWEDCHGKLDSFGYNLVYNNTLCVVNGANSWFGVPAHLDTFDYHGGLTKTYSVKFNSFAVDLGNPDNCEINGSLVLSEDQRGYERNADGTNDNTAVCDIGAYEYNAPKKINDCSGKPTELEITNPDDKAQLSGPQAMLIFRAECADTYRVMVRRDGKKGPIADKMKGLTMYGYVTAKLEKGHTYFWRVKACNAQGCTKSGWRTFTIEP